MVSRKAASTATRREPNNRSATMVDQRDSEDAGEDREQAQCDGAGPEQPGPASQQRIVEGRVDVLRRQGGHLAEGMGGEPDGVAFIPPQRLEIQAEDAQGQPRQCQGNQPQPQHGRPAPHVGGSQRGFQIRMNSRMSPLGSKVIGSEICLPPPSTRMPV